MKMCDLFEVDVEIVLSNIILFVSTADFSKTYMIRDPPPVPPPTVFSKERQYKKMLQNHVKYFCPVSYII